MMDTAEPQYRPRWPVIHAQSAVISDELARVLRSELFQRSSRHRKFLSFIVERTLRGKADEIKELTLATTVFGRPASAFDAQRDPIVRVEAARLRDKLDRYYASDGAASHLRITIPKGRYRPTFIDTRDESDRAPAPGSGTPAATLAQADASRPIVLACRSQLQTHDELALDCYHRGRYAAQQRDAYAYLKAIELLRKAIAIDPGFAQAHAELAMALVDFAGFVFSPGGPLNAEAAVAARRAVALDPGSADANAVLAVCAHRVARDWLAAEALFRQAIALAPDSATGHAAIGFALTTRGRRDEAADHLRIARDLDPLNIGLRVGAGRASILWRRYGQAEADLKAVLEIVPRHAYAEFSFGLSALYCGRPSVALHAFRRAAGIFPGHPSPQLCIAAALALDGRQRDARNQLETVLARFAKEYYCRYHLAIVHAYLGDHEGMYAALEQAAQTGDFLLVNLPVEPAFDGYHSEARFLSFLARNGLASVEEAAMSADLVRPVL